MKILEDKVEDYSFFFDFYDRHSDVISAMKLNSNCLMLSPRLRFRTEPLVPREYPVHENIWTKRKALDLIICMIPHCSNMVFGVPLLF